MNPARDCIDTTTLRPPASKIPAARIAPEIQIKHNSKYFNLYNMLKWIIKGRHNHHQGLHYKAIVNLQFRTVMTFLQSCDVIQ